MIDVSANCVYILLECMCLYSHALACQSAIFLCWLEGRDVLN
jgi:hypothetical protein